MQTQPNTPVDMCRDGCPALHDDATNHDNLLTGVGFGFDEFMSGYLGIGETDPVEGEAIGRRAGMFMRLAAHIDIEDLAAFMDISQHRARLRGTVTLAGVGDDMEIEPGAALYVFSTDVETGARQIVYDFAFTGANGEHYTVQGQKIIRDDHVEIDVLRDMTQLAINVHKGVDLSAPVFGAGILRLDVSAIPALLGSMRATGTQTAWQKAAAYTALASFVFGSLRAEYLRNQALTYKTRYENVILRGVVRAANGSEAPFMLVSGMHDIGFPWGDGEGFWDVLLVIGDAHAGHCQRYCISKRVLTGLDIDLAGGRFCYRGPIYRLWDGASTSFSEMSTPSSRLMSYDADIGFEIQATAQGLVSVPFPSLEQLRAHTDRAKRGPLAKLRRLAKRRWRAERRRLASLLPQDDPLGVQLTPYTLAISGGYVRLTPKFEVGGIDCVIAGSNSTNLTTMSVVDNMTVVPEQTFGEGERATINNLRQPPLRYGYICALQPQEQRARIQIETDTLRDEREHWGTDRLAALAGCLVKRAASIDIAIGRDGLRMRPLACANSADDQHGLLRVCGAPIVEVRNDHYPTAVFLRRIVPVCEPGGTHSLALEESMSCMRLEPVQSAREVTVAAVRNADPIVALEQVLADTEFFAQVDGMLAASGKSKAGFHIVIKPNFMFAYNRHDRSTYTDPTLVAHLVRRLRERGFTDIAVVEAHSTYGEYFDRRSVREMADYLGYRESDGYRIVDLTKEATGTHNFGPHLGPHPVSPTWRDADFRISFAKNKTHAYTYYTLTLKNVYGALPLANKFKEYHCNRDIYHTTIEFLQAFPVHYGLVDAHLSADGPFGVFSDTGPNRTETIIGGCDLVAVDWVAASKMGIDPMISQYMPLAINAFGKPSICLRGDDSVYRPWLNVPAQLSSLTHNVVDRDYYFGNIFYMAGAHMDESHFHLKGRARSLRFLRSLTRPLRKAVFVRTNADPTLANRFVSWCFYKLGF